MIVVELFHKTRGIIGYMAVKAVPRVGEFISNSSDFPSGDYESMPLYWRVCAVVHLPATRPGEEAEVQLFVEEARPLDISANNG